MPGMAWPAVDACPELEGNPRSAGGLARIPVEGLPLRGTQSKVKHSSDEEPTLGSRSQEGRCHAGWPPIQPPASILCSSRTGRSLNRWWSPSPRWFPNPVPTTKSSTTTAQHAIRYSGGESRSKKRQEVSRPIRTVNSTQPVPMLAGTPASMELLAQESYRFFSAGDVPGTLATKL